jgi:hypothetical protein
VLHSFVMKHVLSITDERLSELSTTGEALNSMLRRKVTLDRWKELVGATAQIVQAGRKIRKLQPTAGRGLAQYQPVTLLAREASSILAELHLQGRHRFEIDSISKGLEYQRGVHGSNIARLKVGHIVCNTMPALKARCMIT